MLEPNLVLSHRTNANGQASNAVYIAKLDLQSLLQLTAVPLRVATRTRFYRPDLAQPTK